MFVVKLLFVPCIFFDVVGLFIQSCLILCSSQADLLDVKCVDFRQVSVFAMYIFVSFTSFLMLWACLFKVCLILCSGFQT